MRPAVVIRYTCTSLLLLALFELVSAGVSLFYGKDSSLMPLLFSAFLSASIGAFPYLFVGKVNKLHRREVHMIVFLSWVTICTFGSLPYLFWGEMSVVDCFFESISGFTTTGATIIRDLDIFPRGLLFWRICTAWIGGIGIIVFTILLIPSMAKLALSLTRTDSAGSGEVDTDTPTAIKMVVQSYIFITLATALALRLAGMGWYDSVYHAMSCASTCGFGTRNNSIAFYDNPAIESILVVSMAGAGINFSLVFLLVFHHYTKAFRSEVLRAYLLTILICSVLIGVDLILTGSSPAYSMRSSIFHVTSLLTTTGFAITDTNGWPAMCIVILTLCSIICGCSGSTSGGIKMDRAILAAKEVRSYILSYEHPSVVVSINVDGQRKAPGAISTTMAFIILYMATIAIGACALGACGMDTVSAFSASVASLGNVGPGFGSVGSMDNYAGLSLVGKSVSMVLMLLGRLEILGVVGLIATKAGK